MLLIPNHLQARKAYAVDTKLLKLEAMPLIIALHYSLHTMIKYDTSKKGSKDKITNKQF